MTAIDRDQVLQKLETLHESQAKSHDMALWRDGVWQAIISKFAPSALSPVCSHTHTTCDECHERIER